ncbi:Kinase, NEK [Giardia duodenalis ATCC 50581]|uniref:Kinase, NEK n=1 Tax=Giardia intestinalis (strain ATCC 50581 / GS clone H7) TaxID=598745 RepID=C6LWR3_GIAIB|nr:Kinase, NEK [Giardia intestinalis ATCC 50581]
MSDGNRDPATKNAEDDTKIVPTFSLDELNRCKVQLLGRGAFGKVYVINGFPSLAVKEIWLNGQPDRLVEITKFELEALSRFSHPGVLKYHQVLANGDFLYIIMDRYYGDLKEFIAKYRKNRKSIPREVILSILKQLVDALAYIHDPTKADVNGNALPGIIHRDLKPTNMLISEDGDRVVIADFGLCKDAQHDGITFAGSPPYMAPEAFIHRKTGRASDIWAFGVIIYELATLELPSFSQHWEPEKAKEFFVDEWKPDLSPVKDEFIREVLEKIFILDPAKRPKAKELASLLQASDTSGDKQQVQGTVLETKCMSLETALKDANVRISALERERNIMSVEIDVLKKELEMKSIKIDALEKQFTRITEALEEKTRQLKAEMDQQREEVERWQKELDEALKAANEEIASLRKELTTKSTRVDALKQQLADAINKSDKLYQLVLMKDSSWTPLMCAAFLGDIETAKQHLSDKDKKNSDGDTALMIAARREHENIVELLDPTDWNGVTALMRATDRNDVKAVKALIPFQTKRKADYIKINKLEMYEGTALMVAAVCGNTEVVRLLVEHERDMRDSEGWTALMHAVACGHADCARLLVGKEVGMQDEDGKTALMLAAENNRVDCVKLLLEKESGIQKSNGAISLIMAAARGHAKCTKLLLKKEAGMQNKNGLTALMVAAQKGTYRVYKVITRERRWYARCQETDCPYEGCK